MGNQAKKLRRAARRTNPSSHLVTASITEIEDGNKVIACVLIQRDIMAGTGIPLNEEADRADDVAVEWYWTGYRPGFAKDWIMLPLPAIENNKDYLERISQEPLTPDSVRGKMQSYLGYDFRIEHTPAEKAPSGSWESRAIGRISMGNGVAINTRKRIGVGVTAFAAEREAIALALETTRWKIEDMKNVGAFR